MRSRKSRSGGLKVRKQCLQVVGWLPVHHHRRLGPAQWQCASALLRPRQQPVIGRQYRFSAECPPRAEERRANPLPAIRNIRCRPMLLTGHAPVCLAQPAVSSWRVATTQQCCIELSNCHHALLMRSPVMLLPSSTPTLALWDNIGWISSAEGPSVRSRACRTAGGGFRNRSFRRRPSRPNPANRTLGLRN